MPIKRINQSLVRIYQGFNLKIKSKIFSMLSKCLSKTVNLKSVTFLWLLVENLVKV